MSQVEKTTTEVMKEINDYIKEQRIDTQEMINLLDHTASIFDANHKIKVYDDVFAFLSAEQVEIPSVYSDKQAKYKSSSESLLAALPDRIHAAFHIITQRQLIRFISDYRPGDVRPDDQVKDPKERLQRQTARFIVNQLTDVQKENIYHLIRSEKIENPENAEVVKEFDEVVGYPFEFARKTILKDLDPDLDVIYDVIAKYAEGYTKSIGDTLENMVDQKDRNFNFNSKRIIEHSQTAMRRFNITFKNEELHKEASKEFAYAYATYMEYDGEIQFDFDRKTTETI